MATIKNENHHYTFITQSASDNPENDPEEDPALEPNESFNERGYRITKHTQSCFTFKEAANYVKQCYEDCEHFGWDEITYARGNTKAYDINSNQVDFARFLTPTEIENMTELSPVNTSTFASADRLFAKLLKESDILIAKRNKQALYCAGR